MRNIVHSLRETVDNPVSPLACCKPKSAAKKVYTQERKPFKREVSRFSSNTTTNDPSFMMQKKNRPPSSLVHLERGLGRLLTGLRAAGQDLASALLHAHLALHLLHLLLLAEGQRPGDAEQQRAGADDPQGLAAEAEAGSRPVVGCVGGGGDTLAVGGRDDVGERGDAVSEGFFVGVIGDFACVGL